MLRLSVIYFRGTLINFVKVEEVILQANLAYDMWQEI